MADQDLETDLHDLLESLNVSLIRLFPARPQACGRGRERACGGMGCPNAFNIHGREVAWGILTSRIYMKSGKGLLHVPVCV